jgi:hypothetical protein
MFILTELQILHQLVPNSDGNYSLVLILLVLYGLDIHTAVSGEIAPPSFA